MLSFVAGIVNVAGFMAVAKLTTNVTGHFALFVNETFKLNFWHPLPGQKRKLLLQQILLTNQSLLMKLIQITLMITI